MLHFAISELDRADTAAAWPLVRLAQPDLDVKTWQLEAQSLRSRGGGVLGLKVENGALMGVATYEPVEKPRFGRLLQVSLFVTTEVSRKTPLRRLLMGGLREVAATLGCVETIVAVAKRPPLRRDGDIRGLAARPKSGSKSPKQYRPQ